MHNSLGNSLSQTRDVTLEENPLIWSNCWLSDHKWPVTWQDTSINGILLVQRVTLFGGGILSWLSVYYSWKWLFTLWGSFYIVMLIISVININSETRSTYEIAKGVSLKNQEIKGNQLRSSMSVSNDNTSGKLSPLKIIRTTIRTVDFSWLMFYVATYKLGEQGVVSMLPLYLIDQRIPQEQVGVIFGIFGQLFSISGSTIGGWIVSLQYGHR